MSIQDADLPAAFNKLPNPLLIRGRARNNCHIHMRYFSEYPPGYLLFLTMGLLIQ